MKKITKERNEILKKQIIKINFVFDFMISFIHLIIRVISGCMVILGMCYIVKLNMFDKILGFFIYVFTMYVIVSFIKYIINIYIHREGILCDLNNETINRVDMEKTRRRWKKNNIQKVQRIKRNRKRRMIKKKRGIKNAI